MTRPSVSAACGVAANATDAVIAAAEESGDGVKVTTENISVRPNITYGENGWVGGWVEWAGVSWVGGPVCRLASLGHRRWASGNPVLKATPSPWLSLTHTHSAAAAAAAAPTPAPRSKEERSGYICEQTLLITVEQAGGSGLDADMSAALDATIKAGGNYLQVGRASEALPVPSAGMPSPALPATLPAHLPPPTCAHAPSAARRCPAWPPICRTICAARPPTRRGSWRWQTRWTPPPSWQRWGGVGWWGWARGCRVHGCMGAWTGQPGALGPRHGRRVQLRLPHWGCSHRRQLASFPRCAVLCCAVPLQAAKVQLGAVVSIVDSNVAPPSPIPIAQPGGEAPGSPQAHHLCAPLVLPGCGCLHGRPGDAGPIACPALH